MSWEAAKADAEIQVARILPLIEQRKREHPEASMAEIRLATYPSAYAFRFFRPDDPWSWEHHTAVMRAVKRSLSRRGYSVELRDVEPAAYTAWLQKEGRQDGTAERAMFVNLLP